MWPLALVLVPLVAATPTIYLPINAQVPPVARIGQPYDFTFSEATTASTVGAITYSLHDAPAWLSLDGRTFSGTPQSSDASAFVVNLLARDNTGSLSMSVTLVVTDDPGPQVGMSVADQLPAYGSFQSPDALLVAPSSPIAVSFSPDTFANTNSQTNFYALSANHTPLPSWIRFDPQKLSFVGSAPDGISPADTAETFQIELAASNVVGFSEAMVIFHIIVERHLLEFRNSVQIVNVSGGSALSSSVLNDSLQLDGQKANSSVIRNVTATPPSWLRLDSSTLLLTGTPPGDIGAQNFTVSVTDSLNNSASTMVILQLANASSSSLLSPIGAVNATIGLPFLYSLNDTLIKDTLTLTVDLGAASSWLQFDSKARQLHGTVPLDLKPQQVVVNITASEGSEAQSELLTIAIQKPGAVVAPVAAVPASSAPTDHRWIAAAVVLPICVLISALLLLFCCCRRRRQTRSIRSGSTSSLTGKEVLPPATTAEKPTEGDNGMSGGLLRASSRISLPPRLPWTWLAHSGRPEARNRSSFAEKPHRPDSWSRFAANFINVAQPRPTPFALPIPEETASAPAPAALLEPPAVEERTSAPVSLGSSGLLYKNIMTTEGMRAPGRGHGSVLLSFKDDAPRPARMGTVQRSWRNAVSESSSDWTDITTSHRSSDPKIGARGPTIRPVWPSQTYSKRSSTPQISVPKSVRVRQSENPFLSGGSIYPRDFSSGNSVARHSTAPWRQRRRSSLPTSEFTNSPQRRSSTFDYSIAPRVVDSMVLSDVGFVRDRRYESAVPSESQSMYEYCTSEDDDHDSQPEDNFWRPEEEDADDMGEPGSSAAWLARRKEGGLQRLLKMSKREDSGGEEPRTSKSEEDDDVTEDLRLRSPLARKPGVAGADLTHADTYTSVRGDIRGDAKESGSSLFL